MLSKNRIKFIRSLEHKKFRIEHNAFVAEGNKLVSDMMDSFECLWMLAKPCWMATKGNIAASELCVDENNEINKVSFLKTPQDVIAVFKRPDCNILEADASSRLVLALDGVQDPGNAGTIVRLADWFGIEQIVCSYDTADVFAPKTMQATMGALARVRVYYTDIEAWLRRNQSLNIPIYGTFLDGKDIYSQNLSPTGIIVMGNEGNGIRTEIESLISHRLFIPSYPGSERATSESLNVAIATALTCAEFRRQSLKSECQIV